MRAELRYDDQFHFLRQSAPEWYPWNRIHWELWLQALNTFHKLQLPTNKPRFHCQLFPKGSCWTFQAGKHCSGCKFECVFLMCWKTPGGRGGSARLQHPKVDSLKYWVLRSKPVIPVRVDRIDFLLHGYDRFLKQFLVDGFRFGFLIHFVGERFFV